MTHIAIIGSGPTGIYTLAGLVGAERPLSITIFEAGDRPGRGMPYHPAYNDPAMLANIASIEIPPIVDTLTGWLHGLEDAELARLGIGRDEIDERRFYPRLLLGAWFEDQFDKLVARGRAKGHQITVFAGQEVTDIALHSQDILLTIVGPQGRHYAMFDEVVMATGHRWPERSETSPGYFVSPWPSDALEPIRNVPVGVLGTSLSGIDVAVSLATRHGSFYLEPDGGLAYTPGADSEAFHVTMMSRKGLLPEADFFCPIPYEPTVILTDAAIDAEIARGSAGLLDRVYGLFAEELALADPDYAAKIGLAGLDVETVGKAIFEKREASDPFVSAAYNLAEAKANQAAGYTVPWRYAILRMHEVVARAVPELDTEDLKRFHRAFKPIFVDNYATVPHRSIERLLALHRAGKLSVLALGSDYEQDTDSVDSGVRITLADGSDHVFGAFVDATGQGSESAGDIPFPTLVRQDVLRAAPTERPGLIIPGELPAAPKRTGGIELDEAFRPVFEKPLSNRLYCVALTFLLHKSPFVQGITSARDMGQTVSAAILADHEGVLSDVA